MARYKIISCHVLWRELCHFAALSNNVFDFQFLKQGLHDTPGQLQRELQAAIDSAGSGYEALLIGYGLCSNGIAGITARKTRLVVVRAHDCITHLLGSKERYREYFDQHPGTYWYTPGWIDTGGQPGQARYEKLLASYVEKYGKKNAQYLMEMEQGWFKSYSNAAYIDLGFGATEEGKAYTQKCASWLGWKYDELKGDSGLLERFLAGAWNAEDFLIVEPGQQIVASYDEGVIRAIPGASAATPLVAAPKGG
ncbi:MAG TPA: DUF1638 domain-containing protein [Planctomycetota bacterium]|nr:DUF1638 domain-containing protein [Planctomycetota bacterium]